MAPEKKRKYTRRSDEERIAALQAKISELKRKQVAKDKRNDPVVREIPKIQSRLRKFAQLSIDNDRMDLSNSTMAFVAQLERIRASELKGSGDAADEVVEDDDDDDE